MRTTIAMCALTVTFCIAAQGQASPGNCVQFSNATATAFATASASGTCVGVDSVTSPTVLTIPLRVPVPNINNIFFIDGNKYAATQAGITAALTDLTAAGGGTLILPNQSVTVSSTVACPINAPFVIQGSGPASVVVQMFNSLTQGAFTCNGTETSTSTTLTSSTVIGDTSLAVSSSTGFSVGDWIEIFDTTQPCGVTGQCNYELQQIDSISGGGTIVLRTSMDRAIASGTSTVTKVLPVFASFQNFKIDSSSITGSDQGYSIWCQFCVDAEIDRMKFAVVGNSGTAPDGAGVILIHSKHFRFTNNEVDGGTGTFAVGTNYGGGVFVEGASGYGIITGNTFRKVVEAVTYGEGSANQNFSNNTVEGMTNDGVDVHGQNYQYKNISITGNVFTGIPPLASGSGSTCVALSFNGSTSATATGVVITNNVCSNYGAPGTLQPASGIRISGASLTNPFGNIVIAHNTIRNPLATTATGSTQAAVYAAFVRGLTIDGNIIEDVPANGIGIYGLGLDQFTITSNVVQQTRSATSTAGLYLEASTSSEKITNGTITGNTVSGFANQGIRIDSGASGYASNITVTGNISYNNTLNNYLFSTSATGIIRWNNSGDLNPNANGTATLSSGSATVTFAPTYLHAPICTANDLSHVNTVAATTTTATLSLFGTGSDTVSYICVPNQN
jgi:hypothetical protein